MSSIRAYIAKKLMQAEKHSYSCIKCGCEVFDGFTLCKLCLKKLPFNDSKVCLKCGCSVVGDNLYCTSCANDSQCFERAFSVCEYTGLAKNLVYRLKFGGQANIAHTFAKLMAQTFIAQAIKVDVIVSVPISDFSKKKRGYNQALLIAESLCDIINNNVVKDALIKVKKNVSQEGLTRAQRADNVRGVYKVNNADMVKGKVVLLVDDVKTSGATANECARVLLKANASKVFVLTFASVKQSIQY